MIGVPRCGGDNGALSELVRILVALDVIALTVALAVGVFVAPLIVMAQGAVRWRERLKWTVVSLLTSWFGLCLYWHRRAGAGATSPNRAPNVSR
jgi:hypothetical protein